MQNILLRCLMLAILVCLFALAIFIQSNGTPVKYEPASLGRKEDPPTIKAIDRSNFTTKDVEDLEEGYKNNPIPDRISLIEKIQQPETDMMKATSWSPEELAGYLKQLSGQPEDFDLKWLALLLEDYKKKIRRIGIMRMHRQRIIADILDQEGRFVETNVGQRGLEAPQSFEKLNPSIILFGRSKKGSDTARHYEISLEEFPELKEYIQDEKRVFFRLLTRARNGPPGSPRED